MSSSNCCFLTCIQVSQETGRWSGRYSLLFKNFLQFIVIHTVKGFSVVNETEVNVFLEFSCFFYDPTDIGNLISGSSAFSKPSLNIQSPKLPEISLFPLSCSKIFISVHHLLIYNLLICLLSGSSHYNASSMNKDHCLFCLLLCPIVYSSAWHTRTQWIFAFVCWLLIFLLLLLFNC